MAKLYVEQKTANIKLPEMYQQDDIVWIPVSYESEPIVDSSLKEEHYKEQLTDEIDDLLSSKKNYESLYVRCGCCQSEHHAFIESDLLNKVKDKYGINFSHYFEAMRNPKYITSIEADYLGNKFNVFSNHYLTHQNFFKELGINCPQCKNDDAVFTNHLYFKCYLTETEKNFQIRLYGYYYSTTEYVKYEDGQSKTQFVAAPMRNTFLKMSAIPHNRQYIFDKQTMREYLRYQKGTRFYILNCYDNQVLSELALNNESLKTFLEEMSLYFIEEKGNLYQKPFLIKKIKDYFGGTKRKYFINTHIQFIKYHIEAPFLFEIFPGLDDSSISHLRNNKTLWRKICVAKSGEDILKLFIKKPTKKINRILLHNEKNQILDSNRVNSFSSKKLNESIYDLLYFVKNFNIVENFILKFGFSFNFNKKQLLHVKRKSMYLIEDTLGRFITNEDIVISLLKENNLQNAKTILNDTMNLVLKLDESFENVSQYNEKAQAVVMEQKLIFEKLKSTKSLHKLHDNLTKMYNIVNSEYEKYFYTAEEKELEFKKGDFQLSLFDNSIQLKKEASELRICAYSYSDSIKDKKIVLLSLKEKGNPTMCIEVVKKDKTFAIVQAKLKRNQKINENHQNIAQFLNEWFITKGIENQTYDLSYLEKVKLKN